MTVGRFIIPSIGVLLVACGLFGPEWKVQRGVIKHYADPVVLQLADSTTIGTPTIVAVVTYGGGCVRRGFVKAEVDGLTAIVEPYDSVLVRAEVCSLELKQFWHEVSLQFRQRGTATLRLTGREEPTGRVFTVTRSVEVY